MNTLEEIVQPENHRLELKRSLPSGLKWLKTIIAFANGAGEELIFLRKLKIQIRLDQEIYAYFGKHTLRRKYNGQQY